MDDGWMMDAAAAAGTAAATVAAAAASAAAASITDRGNFRNPGIPGKFADPPHLSQKVRELRTYPLSYT